MAQLTKSIEQQISEVEQYFEKVWVAQTSRRITIYWLPIAEGRTYWVEITVNRDPPLPRSSLKGQSAVKCEIFYPELCLLTDFEFYNLPHTWLPRLYDYEDRFDYWCQYRELPPLLHRGMATICPYQPDYIENQGIDLFEIMKLVASYLTMFEYWRCGFGWQGGGIPHKRNADVELILRKALRRHHFTSASATALDSHKALQNIMR